MKFWSKFKYFHSRKCIWKCRLRNGVHFVSVTMCLEKSLFTVVENCSVLCAVSLSNWWATRRVPMILDSVELIWHFTNIHQLIIYAHTCCSSRMYSKPIRPQLCRRMCKRMTYRIRNRTKRFYVSPKWCLLNYLWDVSVFQVVTNHGGYHH